MNSGHAQQLSDCRDSRPAASSKTSPWACAAAVALALLQPAAAHANFTGDYAFPNWHTALTDPGLVPDSGNGGTVVTSGDTIAYLNAPYNSAGYLLYTIQATSAGDFDFHYKLTPDGTGIYGEAGYVLASAGQSITSNSLHTLVTSNSLFPDSNSPTLSVSTGDTIGFFIYADDISTYLDSAQYKVSSFHFVPTSSPVPEPSSLWLLAAGAMAMTRRNGRSVGKTDGLTEDAH